MTEEEKIAEELAGKKKMELAENCDEIIDMIDDEAFVAQSYKSTPHLLISDTIEVWARVGIEDIPDGEEGSKRYEICKPGKEPDGSDGDYGTGQHVDVKYSIDLISTVQKGEWPNNYLVLKYEVFGEMDIG